MKTKEEIAKLAQKLADSLSVSYIDFLMTGAAICQLNNEDWPTIVKAASDIRPTSRFEALEDIDGEIVSDASELYKLVAIEGGYFTF